MQDSRLIRQIKQQNFISSPELEEAAGKVVLRFCPWPLGLKPMRCADIAAR
jgi:hypothetical protein